MSDNDYPSYANASVRLAVVIVITVICNWLLVGGLTAYYGFQLYKRRQCSAIIHRYPIATVIQLMFILIYIGVALPLRFFQMLEIHSFADNWGFKTTYIVPYCISVRGFVLALISRSWCLYYDARFNAASEDGQWIRHIQPSLFEQNTFILHRGTFGNEVWMGKHIWIPIGIVLSILSIVTIGIDDTMGSFVDAITYIPLVIAIIVLWRVMPQLNDSFRVKDELLLSARWCLALLIVYIIAYTLRVLSKGTDWYFPVCVVTALSYNGLFLAISMIPTYWVLHRSNVEITDATTTRNRMRSSVALARMSRIQHTRLRKSSVGLKLSTILSEKQTFDPFVQHCLSEFSGENVLCIVELIQFRNECNDSCDEVVNATALIDSIKLPSDDFVKSAIVFDPKLSFADKAKELIKKYIDTAAALEVNISYHCKGRLIEKYKNESLETMAVEELCTIFDDCITELYKLLQDTFTRFKTSVYDNV